MSELYHYGTPRHSGRYPWGSGKNPQHNLDMYGRIQKMKKQGISESAIAEAMGFKSTTELRAKQQILRNEILKDKMAQMKKLKDHGYSNVEIAKRLDVTEGTIRNWEKNGVTETKLDVLTNRLKEEVDKKKYLDITEGVETELGTSKESLRTATEILKNQGYATHEIKVPQLTNPSQRTTVKVLTSDEVDGKEVWKNKDKIVSVNDRELSDDISNLNMRPPVNVSADRIRIRYAEEGGLNKDGVIEVRPGAKDLTIPNGRIYAQCRIGVEGDRYLKGMVVYGDPKDFKPGEDIIFNTNKEKGTPKMDVLKEQKLDTDNVFGATVRQYGTDKDGNWRLMDANTKGVKQSPINIVNDDTDWDKWSKNLSAQFLSKQWPSTAKEQLKITYDRRKNEFDEICSLTNPTVKRKLLQDFAESCDSDSVNLKAAAFPGQSTHVLLPLTTIKDTEIYAPNYKNGEQVALVRYPHGGVFEIPTLTVNNNNKEGKERYGNAKKAVGISSKVAEQLSGADFDGDTVTVIPMRGQKLKYSDPLKQLKDYDPKIAYRKLPGDVKTGPDKKKGQDGFHKQLEMGKVSNLITDMTIKGAAPDEIARAVKHSMCVIDAVKHNLDWKRSERENGIKELKEAYQGGATRGASTLISKASSEQRLDGVRSEGVTVVNPKTGKKTRMYIDPNTGEKLYTIKDETYINKAGKEVHRQTKSTKMAEAKDAKELVSPDNTRIELIYADHANRLKALANSARKESLVTGDIAYDRAAAKKYATEVESLDSKIRIAKLKAPQERRAQLIADSVIRAKIADNPELKNDKDALKKKRSQAINAARSRLGLQRYDIDITDKEWEAIQAGAVSKTKLEQILRRADGNRVRELATPKEHKALTASKQNQIKSLSNRGYTQAEIAEHLGVSVSTVNKYL